MADTKLSDLTADASPTTDDLVYVVNDPGGTPASRKVTIANLDTLLSATTKTLTNKTVDEAVISGTPDAAGELGRDTTQAALNYYDNGQLGTIPKVIAVGVGTESKTNSVTTDQDFTSFYTFPANSIFTNKVYRVTVLFEFVMGTSSAGVNVYAKMGSTKVLEFSSQNLSDSLTRSTALQFLIVGRAAAGAAAATSTAPVNAFYGNVNAMSSINQPVNLATNGTLALSMGVTWSATGSTETLEQQAYIIEELN
jgi:hypothetical protein